MFILCHDKSVQIWKKTLGIQTLFYWTEVFGQTQKCVNVASFILSRDCSATLFLAFWTENSSQTWGGGH